MFSSMLSKPLFINATQQVNQTSELSWEVLLSLALELLQKWWVLTSNAATTHMYSLLTYRITLTNLTYKITIRRTRPSRNNQSTKEPYLPDRCDLTSTQTEVRENNMQEPLHPVVNLFEKFFIPSLDGDVMGPLHWPYELTLVAR